MDRDRFYRLIEAARTSTAPMSPSADPDALLEVLNGLPDGVLTDFVVTFEDELVGLNRWSVWGAGYVSEGGLSDDGFHYFRSWLIGKGAGAVEAALEDPDSLANFLDQGEHENEELEYVGVKLLRGRDLSDARDIEGRSHADDAPVGEPFDEETVELSYPRISAAVAQGPPDLGPRRRDPWRFFRRR